VSDATLIAVHQLHLFRTGLSSSKKAFIDRLYEGLHPPRDAKGTFQEKLRKYGGYLKLETQESHGGDKLDRYDDPAGGECRSIVAGCYVPRRAASILRYHPKNNVKGLMSATALLVMQISVMAILVAVSHNPAIPLTFGFGLVESFELSDYFYDVLKLLYDVNLSEFKVESDQGSGLTKYCETHKIVHCFCLRHFLASLSDHMFSCYIGYGST
jgi:hypothetical protein